ncbi:Ig-like domain-containing protein, partial [Salinimicrobium sp. TH3]|uniref:Ig-like domain-containing protein n=1 Tax=Salinimicrobium sp. TH3 TaxID=2997342 RepID=UPI0022764258
VEFFEGTNSLGIDSDGNDGWSLTWTGAVVGTYALTAVATDDKQERTISAVVTVNVMGTPVITSFIPSLGPVGSITLINGQNLENVTGVSFGSSTAEILSVSSTSIEVRVPYVNGKLPKDVRITLNSPAGSYSSFNKFTVTEGTAPVNVVPVVDIISPASNATYTVPAVINVLVTASDSDGVVTKVEFYNDESKLGEDLQSPYEFSWSDVPEGTYSFTAKALDDKGGIGSSEAVTVIVSQPGGNLPPDVSISAPENNATFTAPANITLQANASDPDGSVTSVKFYYGTILIGEDVSDPFSVNWDNISSGTYLLTAQATDNLGAVTNSEVVTITVNAPAVLQAPGDLFAQWVSTTQVNLSWTDNSLAEDGFILERSTKADFSGRLDFISLGPNTTFYEDRNLNSKKGGGILYYRLKAVQGNLSSDYTNVVLATALSASAKSMTKVSEVYLNVEPEESFFAYPNPTSGNATVHFVILKRDFFNLNLYDSKGIFIAHLKAGEAEAGKEYSYNFDFENLSDGIYLIALETGNDKSVLRFVLKR